MSVRNPIWFTLLTLFLPRHWTMTPRPPNEKNVCDSGPCLNGGQCIDLSYPGGPPLFKCSCREGYTGLTCQKPVDPCADEPCLNGGVCTPKGEHYHCICTEKFQGKDCEDLVVKKKKPCANKPCGEHGVCEVVDDDFICECFPGYHGSRCEEKDHPQEKTKKVAIVESQKVDKSSWVIRNILIATLVLLILIFLILFVLCCHCMRVWNRRSELKSVQEAKKAAGKPAGPVKSVLEISNDMCYDIFCCCCRSPVDSTKIDADSEGVSGVIVPVKEYCDLLFKQGKHSGLGEIRKVKDPCGVEYTCIKHPTPLDTICNRHLCQLCAQHSMEGVNRGNSQPTQTPSWHNRSVMVGSGEVWTPVKVKSAGGTPTAVRSCSGGQCQDTATALPPCPDNIDELPVCPGFEQVADPCPVQTCSRTKLSRSPGSRSPGVLTPRPCGSTQGGCENLTFIAERPTVTGTPVQTCERMCMRSPGPSSPRTPPCVVRCMGGGTQFSSARMTPSRQVSGTFGAVPVARAESITRGQAMGNCKVTRGDIHALSQSGMVKNLQECSQNNQRKWSAHNAVSNSQQCLSRQCSSTVPYYGSVDPYRPATPSCACPPPCSEPSCGPCRDECKEPQCGSQWVKSPSSQLLSRRDSRTRRGCLPGFEKNRGQTPKSPRNPCASSSCRPLDDSYNRIQAGAMCDGPVDNLVFEDDDISSDEDEAMEDEYRPLYYHDYDESYDCGNIDDGYSSTGRLSESDAGGRSRDPQSMQAYSEQTSRNYQRRARQQRQALRHRVLRAKLPFYQTSGKADSAGSREYDDSSSDEDHLDEDRRGYQSVGRVRRGDLGAFGPPQILERHGRSGGPRHDDYPTRNVTYNKTEKHSPATGNPPKKVKGILKKSSSSSTPFTSEYDSTTNMPEDARVTHRQSEGKSPRRLRQQLRPSQSIVSSPYHSHQHQQQQQQQQRHRNYPYRQRFPPSFPPPTYEDTV